MTHSLDKICIAIPLFTSNQQEISSSIKNAVKMEPNYLEIRFDYIDAVQEITPDFLQFILKLNRKVPYIFTFRHHSEGGKRKIDDQKRLRIIQALINAKPQFLDIELNTNPNFLREVISNALKSRVKVIFSYHDFYQTPKYEELEELLQKFDKKLSGDILQEQEDLEYVFKVIPTAQTFSDNLIPLKLCKTFSKRGKKIISFCMGEKGIFSRILSVKAGSFFTYASLGEKTAPGQIDIDVIRRILSFIS